MGKLLLYEILIAFILLIPLSALLLDSVFGSHQETSLLLEFEPVLI